MNSLRAFSSPYGLFGLRLLLGFFSLTLTTSLVSIGLQVGISVFSSGFGFGTLGSSFSFTTASSLVVLGFSIGFSVLRIGLTTGFGFTMGFYLSCSTGRVGLSF